MADALSHLPVSCSVDSDTPMEYIKMIHSFFKKYSFVEIVRLTCKDKVLSNIFKLLKKV